MLGIKLEFLLVGRVFANPIISLMGERIIESTRDGATVGVMGVRTPTAPQLHTMILVYRRLFFTKCTLNLDHDE